MPLAFDADDGSPHGEAGFAKFRFHRLKVRVPTRAIDYRLELRFERDGMVGGIEPEVGGLGRPMYVDAIELTFEIANGGEDAGDALDGIEIGVIKRVVTRDGR